jgi:hypothetical protein
MFLNNYRSMYMIVKEFQNYYEKMNREKLTMNMPVFVDLSDPNQLPRCYLTQTEEPMYCVELLNGQSPRILRPKIATQRNMHGAPAGNEAKTSDKLGDLKKEFERFLDERHKTSAKPLFANGMTNSQGRSQSGPVGSVRRNISLLEQSDNRRNNPFGNNSPSRHNRPMEDHSNSPFGNNSPSRHNRPMEDHSNSQRHNPPDDDVDASSDVFIRDFNHNRNLRKHNNGGPTFVTSEPLQIRLRNRNQKGTERDDQSNGKSRSGKGFDPNSATDQSTTTKAAKDDSSEESDSNEVHLDTKPNRMLKPYRPSKCTCRTDVFFPVKVR